MGINLDGVVYWDPVIGCVVGIETTSVRVCSGRSRMRRESDAEK